MMVINIRDSTVGRAFVFGSWSLWFKSAFLAIPVSRCHSLTLLKHTSLTKTKIWRNYGLVLFCSPRWGIVFGRRLPLTPRLAAPLLASPSASCCSGLLSCPSVSSAMLLLLGLDPLLSRLLTIHDYHFSTWPVWPPIPYGHGHTWFLSVPAYTINMQNTDLPLCRPQCVLNPCTHGW